ncbi:DUF1127 domain-containing protein [Falsiroseomonas oryziterrae]|uniref:DUF1127 domain-containing protein n=1 Tax=Falsiroseomonas oryziterrae TaxID=2911368 RepID=UPI001F2301B9|nr:DUF1127 domain-containing protein [Roseomonas sp. NPKOSM-4]
MSGHVLTRPVRRVARPAQARWLVWLAEVLRAIETRRHLAQMDDRMLKDIGVTRADAFEEAARAPWDLDPKPRSAPWVMR